MKKHWAFPWTTELMEKAKQAGSAEELIDLAKENSIELTEESAKAYFERLHKGGEMSDEELDSVSGGGCVSYCPRCGYPLDTENRVCRSCKEYY